MSKDIHKWSDGRYTLMFDEHTFFVWDNKKDERMTALNVTKKLNEQQATIIKLGKICETKMQEIEDIKYGLKEIAYKYQKEVQFKADTDPNQAVKEVLGEQQATIEQQENEIEKLKVEKQMLEKVISNNLSDFKNGGWHRIRDLR